MSRTFYSMRYFNFRLLFAGNILASTGTWMRFLAQDWLVLTELTDHDASQVGVVTALQFAPQLFVTPWAGLLADRLDRRRLLQSTQIFNTLLAVALGVLVLSGRSQLWHLYIFAFLGGLGAALENPTRQAFVSQVVPKESLVNAVGLNSMAFNIGRLLGPASAGLIIDWVGTGWVYIINAFLFLMPTVALTLMRTDDLHPHIRIPKAKGQMREALTYVKARPEIVMVLT
ncbi:MAG: MFS transporter, partial [Actinobacteria bacterium]